MAAGAVATRANASFEQLFARLDLKGDGVITRDELREGYLELILGDARDAALQYATRSPYKESGGADAATASDAVVVCGYGEMGQAACDVLADAEGLGAAADADALLRGQPSSAAPGGTSAWSRQFVAFDRNPARVSVGLAKQMRVVYGDGASPELLRAAGVDHPRAVLVTFANDKRCLEATQRLRDAFPEAPIYVRARTAFEAEELQQAGATEVVIESVETVVRFASLLGQGTQAAEARLRAPLPTAAPTGSGSSPPYPSDELEALADECGISVAQVCRLYEGYAVLEANAEGEVELETIRRTMASLPWPIDEDELEAWMAKADRDGSNSLSFFEYVRVETQLAPNEVGGS